MPLDEMLGDVNECSFCGKKIAELMKEEEE